LITKLKISPLPAESAVEIEAEIPAEELGKFRSSTLAKLQTSVKLDGFRPGQVPEAVLVKTLGEEQIWFEMAQAALAAAYPKLLSDNKIDALGAPAVSLTKLVPGNPLGFKIRVAVYPEIKLPKNYADLKYSELMEKIDVVIPPVIVDREVEKIVSESADYLKKNGKNSVTAARELRPVIEGQVKLGFILNSIAKAENTTTDAIWERLAKKEPPPETKPEEKAEEKPTEKKSD
jgi:FKBP-type peptidyl-prolyl cis-trans isomerase (trigger factor)